VSIKLIVEPGKVYKNLKEFGEAHGPYSIALDGAVDEPPILDKNIPLANFDHHFGVNRIPTRSTCSQVNMYIRMGLFEYVFKKDGFPTANVVVNDPDEDTSLAWWQIANHEHVQSATNPILNRLVFLEDMLDTTSGAYPIGDTESRRQMAWIFEPYNEARFKGNLKDLDGSQMRTIIEAVCGRITSHVLGKGEELALEGSYERIGGVPGLPIIKETGPAARMVLKNMKCMKRKKALMKRSI